MKNHLCRGLLGSLCVFLTVGELQAQPRNRAEFDQYHRLEMEGKRKAFLRLQRAEALAKSAAGQNDFDVTYYGLNLRIDPAAQQISGYVDMRARSRVNDLATVQLDLYSALVVDSVRGDANTFTRQGNQLLLHLRQVVPLNTDLQTRVYYHGRPQGGGFGGFVFGSQAGQPLVWTLSEPYYARSWWPCKDVLGDKADSADVVVTVPATLTAVSNGVLRLKKDNGDGTATYHWHERYPIITYLISLAITNYATFSQWFRYSPTDSMEVRYYVYPSNLQQARNGVSDMVDMIQFFHETFAPYPFLSEKYGIAQFGWGGGMEHQTITSQGVFSSSYNVHELAHQWWGDMTTCATWSDIWLNEGFASYCEALYYEHAVSRDYYHQYMSFMDVEYAGSVYRKDTTSVNSIFNSIVYDKGAWVLHMLRHVVGDSNFFAILRRYAGDHRFQYGNTSTAGFQSVCEEVYGGDLSWFFTPWIYGTGRPFYRYSWRALQSSGRPQLLLQIEQAQVIQNQLFAMPIDIAITMPGADTTITVFVAQALQNFVLDLPQAPLAVALDKDNWIQKYVEETPAGIDEPGASPRAYVLQQNYPNPFNPSTVIGFHLPVAGAVNLSIYDLEGRLVKKLVAGDMSPGAHSVVWDATDDHGARVASGVYVYVIKARAFTAQRKLVLLR